MSQANVELVQEIYDAVARRDRETVLALYHPDVEWDFSRSPFKNVVGTSRYQGHEGLRAWWREWGEAWTAYEDRLKDLIDAGDHVISVIDSTGTGKGSGVEVAWEQYGVWTVRGGQVMQVAWFASRGEALEAAGIAE